MVMPLLACLVLAGAPQRTPAPKMVAYYAQPGRYLTERAADVARIYDGLFFVVGTWDEGVARALGLAGQEPADPSWRNQVRENVRALRAAGAVENLLGVSFSESAEWPSGETLLDAAYTAKMAKHFSAIGRAAKDLGFRGVSIDTEYPYKRYTVDHPIYTYRGYTVEDLTAAAERQGRASMAALLDAFPGAVIWVLPGDFGAGGVGRGYMLGLLREMAACDAPGGFHLGSERAYGLYDPASQVGIPRNGDCMAEDLLTGHDLAYWRRRCSVAPGVWPLHMVETGGPGYPVRPWREELAELGQQMATIRSVAKRYAWSYSGFPVWGPTTRAELEQYGLGKPSFEGAEEALAGWQRVLRERAPVGEPRLARLVRAVRDYDSRRIDARGLCERFGTPGEWLILGPLGNPNIQPQFVPASAADGPVRPDEVHHGREGVVRWFRFRNLDPLGSVRLRAAFGNRATDNASAFLVCDVVADQETQGYLWLGWDDGAVVRLNGKVVLDHAAYPARGHGLLFRDRYLFEDRAAVTIPRGRSRLSVTTINARGSWGVNLRFADADLYPLRGLRFELPKVP